MESRQRRLDLASMATLVLTIVLFAISMIEKGLTHDLLLEAGVLLISVKLVLSFHQAKILAEKIEHKLDALSGRLDKLRKSPSRRA